MSGPLEGIKVVEFARHLAGPFAGMTLGDLGADVIKIEVPRRGDDTRRFPPYWNGESAYYLSTNRNKRSITLHLSSIDGQQIAAQLIKEADILIENFRPGTLERWNLGYDYLHELHPRLIYCSVSAFGSTGPDRNRPGVDLLMQAASGLMSITGEPDRPPVRAGTSLIDLTAGANAVQGILAALYARERTGKGQRVDVSLLGAGVSWLTYHLTGYFATGEVPGPLGSRHASVAPYGAYPTKDGFLVVAVATDALFDRFCRAIELPELLLDERFISNPQRVEHTAVLDEQISQRLVERSAAEWEAILTQAGVASGQVNTLDQVAQMPQVAHDELVVDIPRPDIPELRMAGIAIKLSDTPGSIRRHPPALGEHNDEILTELGFSENEQHRLRSSGIV